MKGCNRCRQKRTPPKGGPSGQAVEKEDKYNDESNRTSHSRQGGHPIPWLASGHRRPHHSGAYQHDGQTADGHVQTAQEAA